MVSPHPKVPYSYHIYNENINWNRTTTGITLLTTEHIMTELSQLTAAARTFAVLDSESDIQQTQTAVDSALLPITISPSSVKASHAIASLWKVMPAMLYNEAASVLDIAVQRQNIMLTNRAAWKWLEVTCTDNCWRHILNCGPSDTWIKCLTDRVDNLINGLATTCPIHPEDFIPGLHASTYQWKHAHTANKLVGNQRHSFIYTTVTAIVRQWLGYPSNSTSHAQAMFVNDMVKTMGHDVLLLNITGRSKYGIIANSQFAAFREHLSNHPLSDPTTARSIALSNIGRLMSAFQNSELPTFMFPEHTFQEAVRTIPRTVSLLSPPPLTVSTSAAIADSCQPQMGNPELILQFLIKLPPFIDKSMPSTPLMTKYSTIWITTFHFEIMHHSGSNPLSQTDLTIQRSSILTQPILIRCFGVAYHIPLLQLWITQWHLIYWTFVNESLVQ